MKKMFFAIICSLLATSSALASDIGKALNKSDVSHLELLANNLNILTLIGKVQDENKGNVSKEPTENTLTKYSVSKDHRMIIEDFFKAPVTMVTNKQCSTLLDKLAQDALKLSQVLVMISPTSLSPAQAQEITNNAKLVVYMQAKENSQLSINCHR